MCGVNTRIDENTFDAVSLSNIILELSLLEKDGLLSAENNSISITEKGSLFIRNICSILDVRISRKKTMENLISKSI